MAAGRDCLVRFSPVVSLRYMADSHGTDSAIAHKLARVARIHFSRQNWRHQVQTYRNAKCYLLAC